jgi:hypothetical protein
VIGYIDSRQIGKLQTPSLTLEVLIMHSKAETSHPQRITLTDGIRRIFFDEIFPGTVSELATIKGLSYNLVYNLVHGRIHSLSKSDYRRIFGDEPPYQVPKRVDGAFFRDMVRLWLFLNDAITESDLYEEFYKGKKFKRVDYRIFSGEIRTIDRRLERIMEQKFLDHGFGRSEIEKGIRVLHRMGEEERVDYEEIRPVLDYLEDALEVNPSRILKQWSFRYESGELRTVPEKIYAYALELKKRTEEAVSSGSRFPLEKLKEEIYGRRRGLTLYSEVEEELEFLRKYARKSPKRYLGRSISAYRKTKLKRIASWRAQKIKDDCNEFLGNRLDLPLQTIPKSYAKSRIGGLLSFLRGYLVDKMIDAEDRPDEKTILTPYRYHKEEYEKEEYGYTSVDSAARVLGMSKKAFDLLLCEHSDIFKRIGIYDEKWYLPNLYLKEVAEKEGFDLVVLKYESLAKNGKSLSCL